MDKSLQKFKSNGAYVLPKYFVVVFVTEWDSRDRDSSSEKFGDKDDFAVMSEEAYSVNEKYT